MIKFDYSKAISKANINKYSNLVSKINKGIENQSLEGSDFLGWRDWPKNYDANEFKDILKKAKQLHENEIEVLVVIGIGGSYLGARAAIEMINGFYSKKNKMEILFIGNSMSSTDLANKLDYVKDKKFAINVISKSGTTIEPAIAFRMFKALLDDLIGKENSRNYIIATTDANKGALLSLAERENYQKYIIPDSIGGRFSILTPVGLFPMACAGIDIKKIMDGAKLGQAQYSNPNIEENIAYQYAAARHILSKKYSVEMLVSYEPQMLMFNEWWKQLFGESEGKNQKGLLPTSAIFSTDLHSLGQYIQDGKKILFETIITIKNPQLDVKMINTEDDLDGLNYLENKTLHEINTIAFNGVTDAHALVGKVPNLHFELDSLNEKTFGELIYMFERACTMSAYLLGVNPFDQPGVEVYKQNMFKLLKQ